VFNDTIGFANQGYYQINNVFETDSCYYAEGSADEIGNFIGKKFFLKFNKQGLLLKSQLYGDISTSFSEYDDGTTIQIGDGFLCCNNVKDTINGYGYLMKVDYNLDTVWSLKFDSTKMSTMFGLGDLKSFTFEDIKVTPDGGYLVAGYLMKLSASNSSSFLLKLDGLGAKQWSRLYDSLPRVSCIELTPDLGILMLDDYGFSQVAKTNALGDLQWTQSVNSSYSYGTPGAIVYAGDSGYVVARPYVYNGNFQMPKYGLNLTKVNFFDGSVIWDKHFDSTWYLESLVRLRCHLNKVKIILLSSVTNMFSREEILNSGFDNSLNKPIRYKDLLQVMLNTIDNESIETYSLNKKTKVSVSEHKLHILITEDNAINQKVADQILKSMGYKTSIAGNGQVAINMLMEDKSIDLVLMDVQMPVMDGITATQEIRKLETKGELSKRIPIVAMTANAMKGDKETALEAGMDDYISKPFKTQIVKEILDKIAETIVK
jgi:CheY-like chemotaxis protein